MRQTVIIRHTNMRLTFLAAAMLLPTILPTILQAQPPDTSLSRHDFLYAGESKERKLFIIRNGQIAWSYEDPTGRGEISDAVLLSNGNILFAHQFAVEEITPEKKIIWRYDVPTGHEVHTAVPIGLDRVLYIQNGNPALLRVVNIRTNVIEKESTLKTRNPASTHGQFRHARLTSSGTLLVAHMDLDRVVEYDSEGNDLWSFPGTHIWGVTPLDNGNALITDSLGVREINRRGDAVWTWKPADTLTVRFDSLQQAWRLPNGNTVINNWMNSWSQQPKPDTIQAIELTPGKKLVWTLRSLTPPTDLGPATTLQFLNPPTHPEEAHFGPIH